MISLISMSQLIVRDIAPEVVAALKQRAASHGRSAEAEHRELLEQALLGKWEGSLKGMLAAMPSVGRQTDFERSPRMARKVKL
jgi:antitoxin FitA